MSDLSVPSETICDRSAHSSANSVLRVRPTIASRWLELKGRPAGFDYMRIVLSVSVLLWHSYLVSYGTPASLRVWEQPAGLALQFILPLFFCLSGFLVYGSLERNPHLGKFLALRVVRLYPALCVEVFVSALILGPIVTSFSHDAYFTSPVFFKYFTNTIGLINFQLPGVFLNNILPNEVNTTLWTVTYELDCYILLSVLFLLGFARSRVASLVMFAACTIIIMLSLYLQGKSGAPAGHLNGRVLVLCFMAGTLMFRFRDAIPYSGALALLSAVCATIMLRYDASVCFAPLFAAYLTVYLGLLDPKRTVVVTSGDYSYGLYLYALPIQQTVAWTLGPANNWLTNVAIALPTTIAFALLSWHFVEKPFLKVKKYIVPGAPSRAIASRQARTLAMK